MTHEEAILLYQHYLQYQTNADERLSFWDGLSAYEFERTKSETFWDFWHQFAQYSSTEPYSTLDIDKLQEKWGSEEIGPILGLLNIGATDTAATDFTAQQLFDLLDVD